MASKLRQKIRLGGGGIAETSSEELAAQAGRSVTPATPMENGVIGGTPQQAAMAGSGAQKSSALRSAIQGEDSLATAQRRKQVRSTATEEEKSKLASGERVQRLGDLGSRVEQLAEDALLAGAEQDQAVELTAEGDSEEVNALLQRLQVNPADNEAIVKLNELQGRDVSNMLTSKEILQQYGQDTGIAEALASSVQDQITSGALNFQDMGFADANEVANLLGTDAEALQGMTIKQLSEQLNAQIANEYSTVSDLQQQANDPALGAAERAEARAQLREMGAVGIRSIESDIDNLADDIAEANTVSFMGDDMPIEELLDNDYVSGIVAKALSQPEFAAQLAEEEPELSDFIKRHQTALTEATKDIEQGLVDFATMQKENLDLGKTEVGDIPEEVMKALVPGFGEMSATKQAAPAVVGMFKDPKYNQTEKLSLMAGINLLSKTPGGETFVKDLGTLDADTIEQLGLTDQTSDKFKNLTTYLRSADTLSQLDPVDYQGTAKFFGAGSTREMESQISDLYKKQRSGMFGDSDTKALEDLFPQGKEPSQWDQKDWENTANKLKEQFLPNGQKLSLRELVNPPTFNPTALMGNVKNYSSQSNKSFDIVGDAFTDDSKIDSVELDNISQNASIEDLNHLYKDRAVRDKADDAEEFESTLVRQALNKHMPQVDSFAATAGFDDAADVVSALESPANSTGAGYDKAIEQYTNFVGSLRDNLALAESRGEELTAKSLSNYINDMENKRSVLDRNYENELTSRRNAKLAEGRANIKKFQDTTVMGQLMEQTNPANILKAAAEAPSKLTKEINKQSTADILNPATQVQKAAKWVGSRLPKWKR